MPSLTWFLPATRAQIVDFNTPLGFGRRAILLVSWFVVEGAAALESFITGFNVTSGFCTLINRKVYLIATSAAPTSGTGSRSSGAASTTAAIIRRSRSVATSTWGGLAAEWSITDATSALEIAVLVLATLNTHKKSLGPCMKYLWHFKAYTLTTELSIVKIFASILGVVFVFEFDKSVLVLQWNIEDFAIT